MAFCTSCGSEIQGQFCTKCGSRVAHASAAPAVPSSAPASGPVSATPTGRKTSPVVWIVGGIVVFFLLIGMVLVGGGAFVYFKAKQAGLDPELMASNPALAMTKLLAATHPELEVVRIDEDNKVVTLRNKQDGKTITVDFRDIERGKFSFDVEGEGRATISGDSGSMEIRSDKGTFRVGEGSAASLPSWIPSYPGSQPESKASVESSDGEGGSFAYKTRDSLKDVVAFYQREMKSAGFSLNVISGEANSASVFGNDDRKRTLMIGAESQNGETTVSVNYSFPKQ
jgi:hypothetical protein